MKIGTYYYPEQWPREQWERDFGQMEAMDLQLVHMGEFAWFALEPGPGAFRFDWLEECVNLAHKRGMGVILCTPTAAPPVWLVEQHPDVLPVDEHGRRRRFGGRRHYSPLSPAMRDATRRVVTALAERFGQHPAVVGWQIDNEYSTPHGQAGPFDQSDHAHAAFRQWLQRRYETVDALNLAWGCQFWNAYYTSFDQIQLPTEREADRYYDNPHHRLDASRFWSWAYADFNKLQADILKARIGPDRFVTTNFMPFHPDVNPADCARDLSLMAWDSYPVTGLNVGSPPKDETYRIADPSAIGFVHDQMASYTGRWGLLELQPGQINWSGVPVLPYPGAVRLWLWTAFAHGAEFVTTYRYRQSLVGVELFHGALVGTDGVTATAGGRQFVQTISELQRLDLSKVPPVADEYDPRSTVGLLFDFEQLWYFRTLPQAKKWDQPLWLQRWYAAVAQMGLRVRVLHPDRPWPNDLPVVVAPGLQMVDDALVHRLDDYATNGGNLIVTCRSGLMDRHGRLWEGPTAAPLTPLVCASVEAYDSLPAGAVGHVEMDGKRYAWDVWADLLYEGENTKVLAKYADQFYAGAAAATRCRRGQGTVTYCGVFAEQAFVDALVEGLVKKIGLTSKALPPHVHLLRRGPYRVLLNYNDTPVTAPAPRGTTFLVGAATVEPAGVAVWAE